MQCPTVNLPSAKILPICGQPPNPCNREPPNPDNLATKRCHRQADPMTQHPLRIEIKLPEWLPEALPEAGAEIDTLEARMALVLALAERNMRAQTGGPFAAALFERDSGAFVTAGVNRVVPTCCSAAHAEMVAITLAQQILGTHDLGGPGLPALQLVVNWRPCAMCFGAIPWSGIRSLVIAGSDDTVERVTGFDEGPIHPDWRGELAARGIELIDGICYKQACCLFHAFAASGAPVYNGRSRGC
jgi:tRNA(Arg) A34 adenosine deaminase TadA